MNENAVSHKIIGAAMKVHSHFGPGLLESAYEAAFAYQMEKDGLTVQRQKAVPLVYETIFLECGYRCDLLVNGKVIVELKAVEGLLDIHKAQLLTHLKLTGLKLGLLLNFNAVHLKDGIVRMVNGL